MGFFKNLLDGGASEAMKANKASAAKLSSMLGTQYGIGSSALYKGLAGLDAGTQAAMKGLAQQGQLATNQIIAQGKQAQGQTKQSLTDKGLYNTSVASQMQQMNTGTTMNALAGLGTQLGLAGADIQMQNAAQKNAAYQNLAQYAMSKVGQQAAITPQYQGGTGLLSGIGQGLGALAGGGLGSLAGGLLGGGGGGGAPSGYGKPSYTPGSFPNL